MSHPMHKEKRPLARAFEKVVGPEFEDSARSGCRRDRQPLQTSRLPTQQILVQHAIDGQSEEHVGTEITAAALMTLHQGKRSDQT